MLRFDRKQQNSVKQLSCNGKINKIKKKKKKEYWSWLPFPSPEDLPDPGIEPRSPALQADSLQFEL